MLYLTCTTITSVDLAHYGVSRAKDWVSVDCGTITNLFLGGQKKKRKKKPVDSITIALRSQRYRVRYPVWTHTFVDIDPEIISKVISPSTDSIWLVGCFFV